MSYFPSLAFSHLNSISVFFFCAWFGAVYPINQSMLCVLPMRILQKKKTKKIQSLKVEESEHRKSDVR